MKKRSRAYKRKLKKIEADRLYTPYEAASLIKETSNAKFDETFEVAIRLGVDPRRADQMVRGTVMLPKGTGREVKVAVFALGDKAAEAEKAGADFVGGEDLVEKVQGGWTEFDAAIATPDMMSMVGRLGKILGPRGLMPNPKSGTVTFDIEKAVRDSKGGKVEYRVDKQANIHLVLGQDLLLRRGHTGELPVGAGGDHPSKAGRGQGSLPEEHHVLKHHGARRPGQPFRYQGLAAREDSDRELILTGESLSVKV